MILRQSVLDDAHTALIMSQVGSKMGLQDMVHALETTFGQESVVKPRDRRNWHDGRHLLARARRGFIATTRGAMMSFSLSVKTACVKDLVTFAHGCGPSEPRSASNVVP